MASFWDLEKGKGEKRGHHDGGRDGKRREEKKKKLLFAFTNA